MDPLESQARLAAAAELREMGDDVAADLAELGANPEKLWKAVVTDVQDRVTPVELNFYLLSSRGIEIVDNRLVVAVPSQDVKDWLLHTFGEEFRSLFANLSLPGYTVHFEVEASNVPRIESPVIDGHPVPSIHIDRSLMRWKTELLDLSRSNRLLYSRPGHTMLPLTHPDSATLFDAVVNGQLSFDVYRREQDEEPNSDEQLDLVLADTGVEGTGNGQAEPILPDPPRKNEVVIPGEPRKVEATLYRFRLKARSALQEQGTTVLFAAFGLLEWRETRASSNPAFSPLVLVPVSLHKESSFSPYKLIALDEEPVFNPALARKMNVDYAISLGLPELDDKIDLQLEHVLAGVQNAIEGHVGWSVHSDAYLGLFSFAKQALYADVEANSPRLRNHPVLRLLSGEVINVPGSTGQTPTAAEMDRSTAPEDVFQVLDADATQQEAIAAAKAGVNIVIQGPPGTGKSQTITNIISEFLAHGKKVLFVSEKRAALQVVAKRLQQAGLMEFCLEAHSQDMHKERVIRDLERVLRDGQGTEDAYQARQVQSNLTRLGEIRRTLNAYVDSLHDLNTPLCMSAYQVHAALAHFEAQRVPYIPFTVRDPSVLTPTRIGELEAAIRGLMRVGDAFLAGPQHPWFGWNIPAFTPHVRAQLSDQLISLDVHGSAVQTLQTQIREQLGLPIRSSLEDAHWLVQLLALLHAYPGVPRHWLETETVEPLLDSAHHYHNVMADYTVRHAHLLEQYTSDLLDLNLPDIISGFGTPDASEWEWIRGSGSGRSRAAQSEERVSLRLQEASAAIDRLTHSREAVTAALAIEPQTDLIGTELLTSVSYIVASNPRPTSLWFEPGLISELRELAQSAHAHQHTARYQGEIVNARMSEGFYKLATPDFLNLLETDYSSWLRKLKKGYRQSAARVRAMLRKPESLDYSELKDLVRRALHVNEARAWLTDHSQELRESFGAHYQGMESDWEAAIDALDAVRRLQELLRVDGIPERTRELLLGHHGGAQRFSVLAAELDAALADTRSALSRLDAVVTLSDITSNAVGQVPLDHVPLVTMAHRLRDYTNTLRSLWNSRASVLACTRSGDPGIEALVAASREALSLHVITEELLGTSATLRLEFDVLFDGIDTNWDVILERLHWTAAILGHFGARPPVEFVNRLQDRTSIPATGEKQYAVHVEKVEAGLVALRSQTAPYVDIPEVSTSTEVSLADVVAWARDRKSRLAKLEEWCDLLTALAAVQRVELHDFIASLQEKHPPVHTWLDALLYQLYTQWLSWRYSQVPALARFRRDEHEALIEEFRRLDTWQWEAASSRIANRLRQNRPIISVNLPKKSEPAILLHEAAKRKRFRPLRKLFADLPSLLPVLKPCLLMSPLAVAQYLGESPIEFDLVIFDEASQILPADAIGAIGRARQLVIVGDQKQLPPTKFFSIDVQINDDDEDEELPESILDTCIGVGLRQLQLLWHYRSRHEDLIAFSNRHFYDDRLITFPSPNADERSVDFVFVPDGVYQRSGQRINKVEAWHLVDEVIEYRRRHPNRTVGVITFSEAQMVAVQSEIDRRQRYESFPETLLDESGPEGFFVKNLENVQGDERDAIFFSVGYGPDAEGKLAMNFGPLNREGGERRLNVAVTRARYEVKIFASFQPEDIDLKRTKARGVRLLRQYLTFAMHGPSALATGHVQGRDASPQATFEDIVGEVLQEQGREVTPRVGVGPQRVDLGIRRAGDTQYLLGLEGDGFTYRAAQTARDRDRLRDQVLTTLGWNIQRVWSTEWVKDPQREFERVVQALEAAERQDLAERDEDQVGWMRVTETEVASVREESPPNAYVVEKQNEATEGANTSHTSTTMVDDPIRGTPYRRTVVRGGIYRPDYLGNVPLNVLVDLAVYCTQVEGPVHVERVVRVMADAFSVHRVSKRTRPFFERAIDAAVARSLVKRQGAFLWSPNMDRPVARAADEQGEVRRIQEVAPEEIQEAVLEVLRVGFAMADEDLTITVARYLGYDRLGSHVQDAITTAIKHLLASGHIARVGNQIRAG